MQYCVAGNCAVQLYLCSRKDLQGRCDNRQSKPQLRWWCIFGEIQQGPTLSKLMKCRPLIVYSAKPATELMDDMKQFLNILFLNGQIDLGGYVKRQWSGGQCNKLCQFVSDNHRNVLLLRKIRLTVRGSQRWFNVSLPWIQYLQDIPPGIPMPFRMFSALGSTATLLSERTWLTEVCSRTQVLIDRGRKTLLWLYLHWHWLSRIDASHVGSDYKTPELPVWCDGMWMVGAYMYINLRLSPRMSPWTCPHSWYPWIIPYQGLYCRCWYAHAKEVTSEPRAMWG